MPTDPFAAAVASPPDFTAEELPPDFWDDEPTPSPSAAPAERPRAPAPTPSSKPTPAPARLDAEAPLFDQLQQLFPGRVVRIDPLATPADSLADETLNGEDADAASGSEDAAQDSLFD